MKAITTGSIVSPIRKWLLLSFSLLFGFLPDGLFAQQKHEWQKVVATQSIAADNFGKSVSIDGQFAIVGAWAVDEKGPESGAAYIYTRASEDAPWIFAQKLIASDGAAFHNFGTSVLIKDDYAIVGAPGHDQFAGAVYLYKRGTTGSRSWQEIKKITARDRAKSDFFGSSLALSAGQLVVGAYGDDDLGSASGAAYVFEQHRGGTNVWGQSQKLNAEQGSARDHFGISVAMDGTYMVIGADGDNRVGSLSVYKKTNPEQAWTPLVQIFASDGKVGDRFAHSVAINGNYLVAGADRGEEKTGAVYVFERNLGGTDNWGESQKLSPRDGLAGDHFGQQLALDSDYLVVGSQGHAAKQGAAYVFQLDREKDRTWHFFDKLMAQDGWSNDLFGCSVAIDGHQLAIGAFQDDDQGSASGGMYQVALRKKAAFAAKNGAK
ncbi:MAG: FG-GAP repeat protein [Bacteroidota bacterium]